MFYKGQLEETQRLLADAQQALQKERAKRNESIAIIGMAMRFPGHINNAGDYWNVLINGLDCISDIPEDRWLKTFYTSESGNEKIPKRQFGFIDEVDKFDQSFFDISPLELENIDPQQRIILELTHEAFENAGIDVLSLTGSNTSVFMGLDNVDYETRSYRMADLSKLTPYAYIGQSHSALSGRVSYLMGLNGPNFTLDAGCAAGLTAVHTGCKSLLNRECDMAVTGAANLILDPELSFSFETMNALAPDSRCKSFDDSGDGYVRSEGCAVLILKRQSDAERDRDNILALIKGSAINQDGRSKRFTAPSTKAQGALHQKALNDAQLHQTDIDYIETHGTGTKVGDPAEMRGIMFCYENYRTKEKPLLLGSVKSNLGHMEATSGLASIIKMTLAFQHNLIPKSIHFKNPNQLIDWEKIPVEYVCQHKEWQPSDKVRFAGVSSFGVTGCNAHVILSEAKENVIQYPTVRNDIFILPLSAKNENALLQLAKKYSNFIESTDYALEDICSMAALRRAHFPLREVFIATHKNELIQQLKDFSESNIYEVIPAMNNEGDIKNVFIFPGQGAQWIQMGKHLYDHEIVYKRALDEISGVYKNYVAWDLIEEINKDKYTSRLSEIDIVQPVLIAVEIALANLWMSKGIMPDIVVGHSMGEIAAAYVAGNISLHEAAQIIITRSRLMKTLSGKGGMGATDLTLDEANELLKGYDNRLSVAVMNSKNSTVLSGEVEVLDALFDQLEKQERFNKKVNVDVASHSAQMNAIKDELESALQDIHPKNSTIQFYSTVKNNILNGEELDANYWAANLREPVQFGNVIQQISETCNAIYIEMSPHPVLLHAVNENVQDKAAISLVTGSFSKEKNEQVEFYKNYTKLYTANVSFNWKNIYTDFGKFIVLPNYAWQKERYWIDEIPKGKITEKATTKNINDNLYEIIRKEIFPESNSSPKNILMVKDDFGYYQVVQDQLQKFGSNVRVVNYNDDLQGIEMDTVLHMGTLSTESIYSYKYDCGIKSLQKIVKHISTRKDIKIIMVTNGANIVQEDTLVNLNASMLIGVLRTIQNEYSSVSFHQIDISSDILETEVRKIPALMFADNKYKEFIVRNEKVFTSIIQKSTDRTSVKKIKPHQTYIVTGGNNGLGLETVKWLVKNGATDIAIISRSGLNEVAQSAINEIENKKVQVKSYLADVANVYELKSVITQIKLQQPEINGVFHAAGILDDAMFENLTQEKFEHAIHAKANGAWNLHKLLQQETLDFFVAFSSGSSVLGTAGQSNYAAANAFLDGLICYRRNNSLSGLSVNWGTVSDIGLASQHENRANRLKGLGIEPIHPDTLFSYFDKLFLSDTIQVTAIDIHFPKWIESNPGMEDNYFYSSILNKNENRSQLVEQPSNSNTFTNVEDARKYVKEQIKLNIASATKMHFHKIKEDDTFKSYGLDSLLALQIKNKLQKDIGVPLNVSVIWSYPTVNKLTNFIVNELKIVERHSVIQSPVYKNGHIARSIEEEVKSLSLDELLRELNEKIS